MSFIEVARDEESEREKKREKNKEKIPELFGAANGQRVYDMMWQYRCRLRSATRIYYLYSLPFITLLKKKNKMKR